MSKEYEIETDWDEYGECIEYNLLTIQDMASFIEQTRGFPSILFLGPLAGEGQSGGRFISDCAKELERQIVDDLGKDEYFRQMDILLGKVSE
tara:strand:+ start:1620 stop:1895 length:276 start_codon:yes stop_codon:yes gene_type:complete